MRYEPVDTKVEFPALEERILGWWRETHIFERTLEARADAPTWLFYEGPPTANGKPGIHHVEPRTFKDVYPRYQTMTGHLVPRKGGWDCHGLPVEIEVEKEIGTTGKRDIEAYGVAAFNERCRASVQRYVGEFERLTERIGFWIDMSDAYWTMSTPYIESVWWSLKQLHTRGLLVQDHKVTAYCPRCGTALSDAEVAQGYAHVADPSVYVRFPIVESSRAELVGASLAVWTTTPWTLPSNEGAAVLPDGSYGVYERDGERVVVAEPLAAVLGDGWTKGSGFDGATLVGSRYEPPYPNVEDAHRVVAADFVSMEDGTGIVHLAPAFGPDDLAIGKAQGWPVWRPVADDGTFTDDAPDFVRGRFVKDADTLIVDDLRERGILIDAGRYEHAYPFCWRCATPLLYFARTSWYVRTTAVKQRLLEVNDGVEWFPEHIKRGRFGNWLDNNVDWALSRERYWGTPLPIWRCTEGHDTAVDSLTELSSLAGRDVTNVDPHRPFIDDVTFDCPTCDATATRVPEVIDTWYDSGAMPFAQWGYHPDLGRGVEEFASMFPADFIAEAIDQTRGWFYTLMAEAVLHFDQTAYRNVVCLGHLIAEDGRKMSKSLGNQFDPWEALERQGADALRWWMLTNGSPWESRRIGHDVLDENVRQLLLPLWNLYSFFVTYANAADVDVSAAAGEPTVMDRWISSQLAGTVAEVRDRMERYDATGAGRRIQTCIDDLSGWYVRRSRRRFWSTGGDVDADGVAAFATLHRCLVTLTQLLAPFTPFVAEELWRNLAAGRDGSPDSVHLSDFPVADATAIDPTLDAAMDVARQVVELGRRVRVEAKVRTRQPLAEAIAHLPAHAPAIDALLPIVAEELNVGSVRLVSGTDALGSWRAKPDFKALGPRLGRRVQEVATALEGDDGSLADRLAAGETVTVDVGDGSPIELHPDDVVLTRAVMAGFGVASDAGVTVALELEVTPELRREGLARELIRVVQDARKAAGLDVSDRIALGIVADGELAAARDAHAGLIAAETLATALGAEPVANATHQARAEIEGEPVKVSLRRVGSA